MANPQTVSIADATETYLVRSPFQPGQPVNAQSSAASVPVYGVNHPGTNELRQGQGIDNTTADDQKVLRITSDGSTVVFDEDDYPALANAHVDSGSLSEADRLRVVVRTLGVGQEHLSILNRVAASATPSSGEFNTSEVSGVITLTIGSAETEGIDYEVWILDADDVTLEATLDQYMLTEIDTYAVISVDAGQGETVTLTKIGQGGGS
jgi:Fe-S cluster assembly iron-binding protein IscA